MRAQSPQPFSGHLSRDTCFEDDPARPDVQIQYGACSKLLASILDLNARDERLWRRVSFAAE